MIKTTTLQKTQNAKVLSLGEDLGEVGGKGVYGARVLLGIDSYDAEMPQNFLPPGNANKTENANAIKVYPNPAIKQFTVEFKDVINGNALIEVYNSIGKLELTDNMEQGIYIKIVDVSNLNDGFYFYKISINGTNVSTGKITVLNK